MYSLEESCQSASKEYLQHKFLWRTEENYPRIITRYSLQQVLCCRLAIISWEDDFDTELLRYCHNSSHWNDSSARQLILWCRQKAKRQFTVQLTWDFWIICAKLVNIILFSWGYLCCSWDLIHYLHNYILVTTIHCARQDTFYFTAKVLISFQSTRKHNVVSNHHNNMLLRLF